MRMYKQPQKEVMNRNQKGMSHCKIKMVYLNINMCYLINTKTVTEIAQLSTQPAARNKYPTSTLRTLIVGEKSSHKGFFDLHTQSAKYFQWQLINHLWVIFYIHHIISKLDWNSMFNQIDKTKLSIIFNDKQNKKLHLCKILQ